MSADRCVKWDDDGGVVVGWTVLAALMRAVTVEVPEKFGIFAQRFGPACAALAGGVQAHI
jgi:hypothetical protein